MAKQQGREVIKPKKRSFIELKPCSNEERGENRDLLQVKCRNTARWAKHESVEQSAKTSKLILHQLLWSRKPARAGSDDHGIKAALREGRATPEKLTTACASLCFYKRLWSKKERITHQDQAADSYSVSSTLWVIDVPLMVPRSTAGLTAGLADMGGPFSQGYQQRRKVLQVHRPNASLGKALATGTSRAPVNICIVVSPGQQKFYC